jgi:ribA/ribD-fused uncharacterized protein
MSDIIAQFRGPWRFLSNFWACQVNGGPLEPSLWFPSAEHAYQSCKSHDRKVWLEFTDPKLTAGEAKRLGQQLVLRPDWNEVKLPIMKQILLAKFDPTVNPQLTRQLLDSGERELIEGNHWGDTFWGVCNGKGTNWLGKLLMEVRREYRA